MKLYREKQPLWRISWKDNRFNSVNIVIVLIFNSILAALSPRFSAVMLHVAKQHGVSWWRQADVTTLCFIWLDNKKFCHDYMAVCSPCWTCAFVFSFITGKSGDKRSWFTGERTCYSKTEEQFGPQRWGIEGQQHFNTRKSQKQLIYVYNIQCVVSDWIFI